MKNLIVIVTCSLLLAPSALWAPKDDDKSIVTITRSLPTPAAGTGMAAPTRAHAHAKARNSQSQENSSQDAGDPPMNMLWPQ